MAPKYQKNKTTIGTEYEKQFWVANAKTTWKKNKLVLPLRPKVDVKIKIRKKCLENSTAFTVSQEDYSKELHKEW